MKGDTLYAMRSVNCYRVETNEDRIEGRGRPIILGYFDKHVDAVNAAKGQGGMGTDAPIYHINVNVFVNLKIDNGTGNLIENWDDAFVIEHSSDGRSFSHVGRVKYHRSWIDPEIARVQALAKLTNEEQELLGLKNKTPDSDLFHPPFDHWPAR